MLDVFNLTLPKLYMNAIIINTHLSYRMNYALKSKSYDLITTFTYVPMDNIVLAYLIKFWDLEYSIN